MTFSGLSEPLDGIVFDCDGTLSKLEAIDFLATLNGVGEEVSVLTRRAMNEGKLDLALYKERLRLASPTAAQLDQTAREYVKQKTEGLDGCLAAFRAIQKPVFIISAGLKPAVNFLAEHLGVPLSNVFAVDIFFDRAGHYSHVDEASPLTSNAGKREVIQQLKIQYPRLVLIGDGANDLIAADLVTRFIGFGGNYYHPKVANESELYIQTTSLLPILPLCLTEEEYEEVQSLLKVLS